MLNRPCPHTLGKMKVLWDTPTAPCGLRLLWLDGNNFIAFVALSGHFFVRKMTYGLNSTVVFYVFVFVYVFVYVYVYVG